MVTYRAKRCSVPWFEVLNWAEVVRGRPIDANSLKRTMAEQRVLRDLYERGEGNLAAEPSPTAPHIRVGRDDHAADIDTGRADSSFIDDLFTDEGFPLDNTVAGEGWHKEFRGGERALHALQKRRGLPVLTPGRAHAKVLLAKDCLEAMGRLEGDGSGRMRSLFYGSDMLAAVKTVQRNNDLLPDGVIGPNTWRVMMQRAGRL